MSAAETDSQAAIVSPLADAGPPHVLKVSARLPAALARCLRCREVVRLENADEPCQARPGELSRRFRAAWVPGEDKQKCDECGAIGPTVLVASCLPLPGRYCRARCIQLRDLAVGVTAR